MKTYRFASFKMFLTPIWIRPTTFLCMRQQSPSPERPLRFLCGGRLCFRLQYFKETWFIDRLCIYAFIHLHTFYPLRYDVPSAIPDASIQRAGENVQAIIREVSTSSLLRDPGEDRHGKVVFFDLFGKMVVVYPERVGAILNTLVGIASLLSIYFATSKGKEVKKGTCILLKTRGVACA